jgi:ankyrin repeat protein
MSNGIPSEQTLSNAVNDHIAFENISELVPPLRFLLTCGPLPDINIARSSLDDALRSVRGDITKIRMNAAGFTALEWAAKKGNGETVEWLCTDDRTKALVKVGSPVGWACYTGQVDIARALVAHGADPNATDAVLWTGTPPLLVAAQNGKLEAMKYLVEELGQDIHMRDPRGRDIMWSIKTVPNWKESGDINAVMTGQKN